MGKVRFSKTTLALLAILLVALFLRLYQLETKSIWLDEATEISIARNGFVQITGLSLLDRNFPLHYLLLHYWMLLFGDSEFSVRLPSALFGLLSVAMLYKVGALLFGKETGLIGAVIMAISGYQVYYSQEARPYAMMLFLALVSFYFFLRLFEGGKDYRVLAAYVLSAVLLISSHIYGLFFVVAQALFLLGYYALEALRRRSEQDRNFRAWALAGGALAIASVPVFLYFAYQLTQPAVYQKSWIKKSLEIQSLDESFTAYAGAPQSYSPVLLLLLTFFALISVVALARSKEQRAKLYLLSLWLVVPIALPLLLSRLVIPIWFDRYSIGALPALYLLAAEGIRTVGSVGALRAYRQVVPFAALAVIIFFSIGVLQDNYAAGKEPWRALVKYVEATAEPGDLVFIASGAREPYDYYARREDLEVKEVGLGPDQAEEVGSELRASDRVWLVLRGSTPGIRKRFKARLEEATYEPTYHKLYRNRGGLIDLTLFEKQ